MKNLFVIMAIALFSSPLFAASDEGQGKFFLLFDTNQDNMVTKNELVYAGRSRFQRIDSDGNGVLSRVEFSQRIAGHRDSHKQHRFTDIDGNGDGRISQEEFLDYKRHKAEGRFATMDANSDGMVDADEFTARHRGHHDKWEHEAMGDQGMFDKLDRDRNGEVSQEEALAVWNRWFDRLDRNGDNVVSKREVKQARHKLIHNIRHRMIG